MPPKPFPPTTVLLLGLCLAPFASAQPAPRDDEPIALENFTVTGSHIAGLDTEKTLPVTVFAADDFTNTGVGSFAELVETMPFSTAVSINETGTGPNDARGDVSTINLRNLGAGRTLVLLNGRRLSAHGVTPGTPPVQFVNVNAIPLGAVQQVEVLRDGASAIYGSDAIGGVVNTVLRKNYDGFNASARYAFGDPAPREFTFNLGGGRVFNAGRTKLSLFYSAYHREGLMAADRAYAANADKRLLFPDNVVSSNFNRLSASGPQGRFTAVNDAGSGVSVPGVTATNGQFHYDPVTGARATGAGPSAFYNSQNNAQLIPDVMRSTLFGSLEHRLGERLTFFGEASYYDSHSSGAFDATPISAATDGVIVPKTNYYSPVGVNSGIATPRNVAIRNLRITEAGPRSYDTYSDSVRLLAGLRGGLAGATWTWESAVLHMRGETEQFNHGYISQSLFTAQLALNTPAAYNPFAVGTNPASSVAPFVIDIWDKGVGTLTSWDAKASGELFNLPGGAVSTAAGLEYRRETMKQRNDPHGLADDVIAQSEQLDVSAAREVQAAYAEVLVPIVGAANRVPLFHAVELRGAVRYEHYTGFDATKPGVGLSWRPFSWLLLRGSYNEGFRAPTIVELYTPAIGRRNDGIVDTARTGQPDAAANVSKRTLTGGNPNLQPEESESCNAGVVVDVPFVKGLTFGADLYRVKQFNQIDNSSAQFELDLDAQFWAADGGSNPRVVRAARTAADQAAGLPGVLVEVLSTYQNLSLRHIEGADVYGRYRTPQWAIGRFDFTGMLTYTDTLYTINERGSRADLIRNSGNPRVKSTFGVSWSRRGWSASVTQRYTSDYLIASTYTIDGARWVIDDYWVTNAGVGYRFSHGRLKGLRLRVGVNNVFDEAPPFYPASTAGYDTDYADPRGRMPYVDASFRF